MIVFVLGVGGVLFAGYLSAVKFFSGACALNESCPYFLGYPACYYGFLMYTVIAVYAGMRLLDLFDAKQANTIILATSFLGILFSGYFTLGELPVLFSNGFGAYVFGLPTCALGLIFYTIIFFLSLRMRAP